MIGRQLGMIEHVGYKNYDIYMKTAAHCLKDDGAFLLQCIGVNHTDTATSPWIDTYIFPNGEFLRFLFSRQPLKIILSWKIGIILVPIMIKH